jgi:hypothetical protein
MKQQGDNMSREIDITREIEQIEEMLRTNTDKKIDLIRYFLISNTNIEEININSKSELITFLQHSETPYDVVEDIYDLLDQTFSRGYPNFIYEFELTRGNSITDLANVLSTALPDNEETKLDGNVQTYLKRVGDVELNLENETVRIKVQYERFKEERDFGGTINKGMLEIKSTFDIVFDFQIELCYVKCGDRRQLSAIEEFLQTKIIGVFRTFTGYSFNVKQISTEVENQYQLDKQTIILLDFLENEINKENYKITDYFTIAFSNSHSDKVKSVRLGGTNLLESTEVADRISQGDKIKSVRFQLQKQITADKYNFSTVKIDFSQTLKITFSAVRNARHIRSDIQHIINALNESLDKTHGETKVKQRLSEITRKVRIMERTYLFSTFADLKIQLLALEIDESTKDQITLVLDKYIVEGDN